MRQGFGTGAIVSATTDSNSPAGSGLVQTFGIHFENLLIATITTLVVCISNYNGLVLTDANGIEITLNAFEYHMGSFGSIFVTIVIFLFGISTIWAGYYLRRIKFKIHKKNYCNRYICIKSNNNNIFSFG